MRRNRDTAMTPGARIAAAIAVLDAIAEGAPAEKTLTTWARRNRFAGSGDRAAIRDHVFDALRCWRSAAWLGGAETGRGRMIGVLRDAGADPEDVFTGQGHAPPPLSAAELETRPLAAAPLGVRLDLPDWLLGSMTADLGDDLPAVAASLRRRAPLFLRANAARTSREAAQRALAEDGIGTRVNDLSPWALEVTSDPRRVQRARAYSDGLVEVQDAASQAVCAALPAGGRVLDFCAGGGGKSPARAASRSVWPGRRTCPGCRASVSSCATRPARAAGPGGAARMPSGSSPGNGLKN